MRPEPEFKVGDRVESRTGPSGPGTVAEVRWFEKGPRETQVNRVWRYRVAWDHVGTETVFDLYVIGCALRPLPAVDRLGELVDVD